MEGAFPWGEARLLPPGTPIAAGETDAVVALGDVPADPPDGVPLVRWLQTPATASGRSHRIAAPDGLWRRARWPAADALFELPRSPEAGALVVGPAVGQRDGVTAKLESRAIAYEVAERLTRKALERAAVVALVGSPGDPLPVLAPAVAAAGRALVTPRAEPAFGLLAGIDHLAYDNEDELAQLVDLAVTWPHALETVTAMGRIAAEPHRASAVYGRLAIDLELEAAAPAAP